MDYIGKGDVFLKVFWKGKSIVEFVSAISISKLVFLIP